MEKIADKFEKVSVITGCICLVTYAIEVILKYIEIKKK